MSGLRALGIGGVSVTIPFKAEIIPFLDELDPQAATIGAVNTVVNRNGRLTGYNTDWLGAVTALTAKISLKGQHVLILGAGGASPGHRLSAVHPERGPGQPDGCGR